MSWHEVVVFLFCFFIQGVLQKSQTKQTFEIFHSFSSEPSESLRQWRCEKALNVV